MEFSLSYSPKPEYNEIGYHKTLEIYKNDIMVMGFTPSKEDDDWLGEGVYFWDDIRNALWWKQNGSILKNVFLYVI